MQDDGWANHTTSRALTDIGGGATFYDNLVEVRLSSRAGETRRAPVKM